MSEDIKHGFDSVIPQKKKAISFIESACGLESIEESPGSRPRRTLQQQEQFQNDSASFIVFGDVDKSSEKKLRKDGKSGSTPEVFIENEESNNGSSGEKNKSIELR